MHHNYRNKRKDPVKANILFGILFISLLGTILHFLYGFSGNMAVVGIISPINESVWEHLKLAYIPTLLWWIFSYIVLSRKGKTTFGPWFFSAVISSVISTLFIVVFYYTYTGAFGIHSLILEISSLYIGIIIAQLIALFIYQHAKLRGYHYIIATLLFLLVTTAFIVFTFIPPHLPLFMDSSTGQYGL